jgi:DUF1707 SHOCT-like domain
MSWDHEDTNAVTLAADADRDAAVGVLNEAFAEGRLTADEHAERVRQAYAARTWQELSGLTADLPVPAGSPGPAGTAGQTVTGVPVLDRWLLCALLCLCPPAGIAWLLPARYHWGAGRRDAVTAEGRSVSATGGAARAEEWRVEDR